MVSKGNVDITATQSAGFPRPDTISSVVQQPCGGQSAVNGRETAGFYLPLISLPVRVLFNDDAIDGNVTYSKMLYMIHTKVNSLLTLRLLMSYIYGAPILDVSRSHTTTQHSR